LAVFNDSVLDVLSDGIVGIDANTANVGY
jgi:hypothetical protein